MDLNTVVKDVALIRVAKKTIIHKALGSEALQQIYFDPSLLLQVLSNLCLNAVKAMDEGKLSSPEKTMNEWSCSANGQRTAGDPPSWT